VSGSVGSPPGEERQGPLTALRVVDMSSVVAGPQTARYLADFGADVVKLEPPSGDSARSMGLNRDGDSDSYFWKLLGRNKRSVVVDLKSSEGRSRFERIVRNADVLIENLRPGKLEATGFGPDVLELLNPRLVLLRVTGFGQDGPYAGRPGFATMAEAMSGFAGLSGEPDGAPMLPPIALTDEVTGLVGAFAVMAALWNRHSTGRGQVIDVNLLDSLSQLMGPLITAYADSGYLQPRMGSGLPYSVPRGTYRTKDDRWIAISGSADVVAQRILVLLGVKGDPRFVDHRQRALHRAELDELLGQWMSQRTSDEALAEFERVDAAAAPVYTIADLVDDPHVRARQSMVDVDGFTMQGLIARFSQTPGVVRFAGRRLGADTDSFDDWAADA
jgi:crotonobetainyl-CoA:carnitine CoA-transferase CaiB-like acyl-CoA transferase